MDLVFFSLFDRLGLGFVCRPLFFSLLLNLGFGSIRLKAETFLFPLPLTQLGLGLGSVRFFFVLAMRRCRTAVRPSFPPRGGGGFSLFFYPVRVRVQVPRALDFLLL